MSVLICLSSDECLVNSVIEICFLVAFGYLCDLQLQLQREHLQHLQVYNNWFDPLTKNVGC